MTSPIIHKFRSRTEPDLPGWYIGCTCGWDPDRLLYDSPEAGERVWLDDHMRPEHIHREYQLEGSGWMVSCKCGWIAADFQKSWEWAVAVWEKEHYAQVKAEQSKLDAEERAAEARKDVAERAEVVRRIAEIKQKYTKKK